MRQKLRVSCVRRYVMFVLAALLVIPAVFAPRAASAGFFDFLFGDDKPASGAQARSFADPFGTESQPAQPRTPVASAGRGTSYCVRTCDGRYFPLTMRGGATPAQVCQSFCPASATKVFFGSTIDNAVSAHGERYADSPNAFSYRKALKADCTCNGRDSAGLAPVDLSLDTTLRPGDIVATSTGLVAYSGTKTATGQTAEFTPVASYPGLTADLRARLGGMKVAPVSAEVAEEGYLPPDDVGTLAQPDFMQPAPGLRGPLLQKDKRADLN
ncbi:DUF2865 domain-containing protein [Bradyrhizobium sp. SYSU BS000235]|uniref:DUF2865 domain-containing protein n=1 Tax=Bradyrhizobium sp. SYSU BS000235 TaxID=3411332 RepID=UPI003C74EB0A